MALRNSPFLQATSPGLLVSCKTFHCLVFPGSDPIFAGTVVRGFELEFGTCSGGERVMVDHMRIHCQISSVSKVSLGRSYYYYYYYVHRLITRAS